MCSLNRKAPTDCINAYLKDGEVFLENVSPIIDNCTISRLGLLHSHLT